MEDPLHERILNIFYQGWRVFNPNKFINRKHSKVENPFYISASTSILDPNKTILILIRQGHSPASPYGAYAYEQIYRVTQNRVYEV